MSSSHKIIISIEQVSQRKTLNSRKVLQMALLNIHENQNKYKQQKMKSYQMQIFDFNRNQRHILLRRFSSPKVYVMQTIKSRKRIELNTLHRNQIPKNDQLRRIGREINKQKIMSKNRAEDVSKRINHKVQKVHIRANINLLSKNRELTQSQRILTNQDAIKHEHLNQSFSCREILAQEKKLFSNNKIKGLKNNLFRTKISTKNNQRAKVLSRSLQSKNGGQEILDEFTGWQTNIKFQQPVEFEEFKNQPFLS